MNAIIELLILYAVLFFRISYSAVQPAELAGPAEFSVIAEISRIIAYTIPSLALVWYLMLKTKSLKEWGVSFPGKKDILPGVLSLSALFLISFSISFVSRHYFGVQSGMKIISPGSFFPWTVLVFSCIFSAYLEESFFRFYLLSKRTEMKLSPHMAVIISTLLFSFCHVYEGPWGFLNAVLSGVILAIIFLRFKSLHGISIAHAMYNILVYALNTV